MGSARAVLSPPTRPPLSTPSDRPREPSDFFVGLAVSLLLHLLVLVIASFSLRLPDVAVLLQGPEPVAQQGAEVLMIDVATWPRGAAGSVASAATDPAPGAPAAGVAAPALPSPTPGAPAPRVGPREGVAGVRPAAPTPVPGVAAGAPGAGATPARDRFQAALEALRPRLLDPRLRPGSIDALRTDEERAAQQVYARINALNDSILAEMERGRRATDWTFTDDEGRRWGVSPGKLHLGGIELPLPLNFTTAEQRERIREWEEIQAQAVQGEVDEVFDDRVEAIREQRDSEREE